MRRLRCGAHANSSATGYLGMLPRNACPQHDSCCQRSPARHCTIPGFHTEVSLHMAASTQVERKANFSQTDRENQEDGRDRNAGAPVAHVQHPVPGR